jgi:hypothetical protein
MMSMYEGSFTPERVHVFYMLMSWYVGRKTAVVARKNRLKTCLKMRKG